MSVVIDASVLVVLGLDRRRAPAVEQCMRQWRREGEELHAPTLLRYEIASALTHAVALGQREASLVTQAWEPITAIRVALHQLDDGPAVVSMAQRSSVARPTMLPTSCSRSSSEPSCVTLGGALARSAGSRGLPVKLIDPGEGGPGSSQTTTGNEIENS